MFENSGYSSQPQGSVVLDGRNTLAVGLIADIIGVSNFSVVRPISFISNTNANRRVGPLGSHYVFNSSSTRVSIFNTVNLARATVLCLARVSNNGNGHLARFGRTGQSNALSISTSSGLITARVGSAGTGTVATPSTPSVIVLRYNGANANLFVSGNLLLTQAATYSVGGNVGIGDDGNDTGTGSGDVYLSLFWNRALSDAEIASVSANPWQLFQRRNATPIFTPTGDSGVLIPDLSSPGVIDVTSNSAKPELNVQY